jgi:hypothetical protein
MMDLIATIIEARHSILDSKRQRLANMVAAFDKGAASDADLADAQEAVWLAEIEYTEACIRAGRS